jgi:hypothetical protein
MPDPLEKSAGHAHLPNPLKTLDFLFWRAICFSFLAKHAPGL